MEPDNQDFHLSNPFSRYDKNGHHFFYFIGCPECYLT